MRTFSAKTGTWWFHLPFWALAMSLFLWPGSIQAATTREEGKTDAPEHRVFGRDPKAFANASAMLAVSDLRLMDEEAARTSLEALDAAVTRDASWSPALWMHLDKFRSARLLASQIRMFQDIAKKMVIRERAPSPETAATAKQAFVAGNRHYEAGNFDLAAASYRSAVQNHPSYWDACNNMALSELHRSNDLIALFVLTALRESHPQYTGAGINLSVCLERLGRSTEAYETAAALVASQVRMPMAHYNMAWFENARGDYPASSEFIQKALMAVPDYAVARWLKSINAMESGRSISADELKALPHAEQFHGIPHIVTRPVKIAMADACSGKDVVARIPQDTQLLISKESGDWCGFYWPVDGVKRFLWTRKANLGSSQKEIAAQGPKSFLGTWTGKWGKFTEQEIRIQEVAGKPKVTIDEDKVGDEKLENGTLSFWAKKKEYGGEWFRYTLRITSDGLEMDVYRTKNAEKFTGKLTKK